MSGIRTSSSNSNPIKSPLSIQRFFPPPLQEPHFLCSSYNRSHPSYLASLWEVGRDGLRKEMLRSCDGWIWVRIGGLCLLPHSRLLSGAKEMGTESGSAEWWVFVLRLDHYWEGRRREGLIYFRSDRNPALGPDFLFGIQPQPLSLSSPAHSNPFNFPPSEDPPYLGLDPLPPRLR